MNLVMRGILPDGIMCVVLPHGVLFRGGEEGSIRKNLAEKHLISEVGVVGEYEEGAVR